MLIVRTLRDHRMLLGLGLLGLVALAGGCGGGNPNEAPPAPPTTQAQQDAERAAREKAFGKMTIPGKPSSAKK